MNTVFVLKPFPGLDLYEAAVFDFNAVKPGEKEPDFSDAQLDVIGFLAEMSIAVEPVVSDLLPQNRFFFRPVDLPSIASEASAIRVNNGELGFFFY